LPELVCFRHGTLNSASTGPNVRLPPLGSGRLVKIAHIARFHIRFRHQRVDFGFYRAAVRALQIAECQVAAAPIRVPCRETVRIVPKNFLCNCAAVTAPSSAAVAAAVGRLAGALRRVAWHC
jgi:hypothetical protein